MTCMIASSRAALHADVELLETPRHQLTDRVTLIVIGCVEAGDVLRRSRRPELEADCRRLRVVPDFERLTVRGGDLHAAIVDVSIGLDVVDRSLDVAREADSSLGPRCQS